MEQYCIKCVNRSSQNPQTDSLNKVSLITTDFTARDLEINVTAKRSEQQSSAKL